jgi:pimeloyl-ACP methyl ester carboxylesterase
LLPQAGVLSLDARGHGETTVSTPKGEGSTTLDLSLETLSDDMIDAIRLTQTKLDWEELPPLVLVGHSLGGAVVTDVAKRGAFGDKVLAYAVLDVVEGLFLFGIICRPLLACLSPLTFAIPQAPQLMHYKACRHTYRPAHWALIPKRPA